MYRVINISLVGEVCEALDATIDNINFPINDVEELKRLSSEFHLISRNKFKRNEGIFLKPRIYSYLCYVVITCIYTISTTMAQRKRCAF